MSFIIKDANNKPVQVNGESVFGSDNFETEAKDFKDKDRSFVGVASTSRKDRMGDIIVVEGWNLKTYRKNPVVQPFHRYDALPVGRSLEEFVKGQKLMFRPQFAPTDEAAKMYSLFRDKYLKGFSVGFIPIKSEPIEDESEKKFFFHSPTRYLKTELLEVSVAPVPANPDCLAEIRSLVKKGDIFIPMIRRNFHSCL
jgi:HK97 family phage prohead protease